MLHIGSQSWPGRPTRQESESPREKERRGQKAQDLRESGTGTSSQPPLAVPEPGQVEWSTKRRLRIGMISEVGCMEVYPHS